MRFSILTALTLVFATASAQDPQLHKGVGAECVKNRDCCPCDTGSGASIYCQPDATSSTKYRCRHFGNPWTWCQNNRGQCGDWDHLS
ncbi:hypothetical protein CGLO_02094 [Colletotrichum gloeosporioides Cg-14]|uniref:Uncharacterized protein n=1 Tax=Colletotrichum gloeosporioides (strain Cg-14) TaxID=1237896 RepID=T0KZV2_COLGC|nr:hypothetical protein CGLO_02094 [Colletotrichum gloeosporioides Cg-14]